MWCLDWVSHLNQMQTDALIRKNRNEKQNFLKAGENIKLVFL